MTESDRSNLLAKIEAVLDGQVREALARDGGGVEVAGIDEDRIVQVRLLGSCQGCSSATITMTMMIERAVKAAVPEVRFLEAVL